MKKIKLILAITAIAMGFYGLSVAENNAPPVKYHATTTFQYEMRNLILEGNFIDSGNGNGSQKISVVVGIVGEPYGFVKTNTFDVGLKTSVSIDANKLILRNAALEFISTNYPDK